MPGRIHSREFKLRICRQIANGEKRHRGGGRASSALLSAIRPLIGVASWFASAGITAPLQPCYMSVSV